MTSALLRRAPLALAALLALAPLASAQTSRPSDEPDPKDHEFNEVIPTTFAGALTEMTSAAGASFQVYVTGPEEAKAGLVVIHEWWGLNAHIKGVADDFAKLGYRVFAIDLYGGEVAKDAEQAGKLMKAVDEAAAQAKLKVAIAKLGEGGRKVGTIGWCFGGGWSLQASLANPDKVAATVIYYGRLVEDPEALKVLKAPVLGIFAAKDGWITADKAKAFDAALDKAGVEHSIHIYDANHAFANPSGDRFHRPSARDAWAKTVEFFKTHLH